MSSSLRHQIVGARERVQRPGVGLRSRHQLVRKQLVFATIAIVGLAVAVAVSSLNSDTRAPSSAVARANQWSISSSPGVQPNPDEHQAVNSRGTVQPNPDEQLAISSSRTVQPNPDEQH